MLFYASCQKNCDLTYNHHVWYYNADFFFPPRIVIFNIYRSKYYRTAFLKINEGSSVRDLEM